MGQEIFNSSGVFTVPEGITEIEVRVYGGGGGGHGGHGGGTWDSTDGHGGLGGEASIKTQQILPVVPLEEHTVIVGLGGEGGYGGEPGDDNGENGDPGGPGLEGLESSILGVLSAGALGAIGETFDQIGGSGEDSELGSGGTENQVGASAAGGGGGHGGRHDSNGTGDWGSAGGYGGVGQVDIRWNTPTTNEAEFRLNGDIVPMVSGALKVSGLDVHQLKIIRPTQDETVRPVWSSLAPPAIADLVATTDEIGQVTLTWSPITTGIAAEYSLFENEVEVALNITSPYVHIVSAGTRDYYVLAETPAGDTPSNIVSGISL